MFSFVDVITDWRLSQKKLVKAIPPAIEILFHNMPSSIVAS
jgi:hypothetical protein